MMQEEKDLIQWSDFAKIDIRVGTVISAEVFKEAKKPAYKIIIDFGELGIRKTSAQITSLYQPQDIVGMQVVAVVNFPTKQIANIQSECLLLGAINNSDVTLLTPSIPTKNGLKIG